LSLEHHRDEEKRWVTAHWQGIHLAPGANAMFAAAPKRRMNPEFRSFIDKLIASPA
jgi:hypothetical protein